MNTLVKKMVAAATAGALVLLSPGLDSYRAWAAMEEVEAPAVQTQAIVPATAVAPQAAPSVGNSAAGPITLQGANLQRLQRLNLSNQNAPIGIGAVSSEEIPQAAGTLESVSAAQINQGPGTLKSVSEGVRRIDAAAGKPQADPQAVAAALGELYEGNALSGEPASAVPAVNDDTRPRWSPSFNGVLPAIGGPREVPRHRIQQVPARYIPEYGDKNVVEDGVDRLVSDPRYTRAAKVEYLADFYELPSAAYFTPERIAGGSFLLALLLLRPASPLGYALSAAALGFSVWNVMKAVNFVRVMKIIKAGWEKLHPGQQPMKGTPWHLPRSSNGQAQNRASRKGSWHKPLAAIAMLLGGAALLAAAPAMAATAVAAGSTAHAVLVGVSIGGAVGFAGGLVYAISQYLKDKKADANWLPLWPLIGLFLTGIGTEAGVLAGALGGLTYAAAAHTFAALSMGAPLAAAAMGISPKHPLKRGGISLGEGRAGVRTAAALLILAPAAAIFAGIHAAAALSAGPILIAYAASALLGALLVIPGLFMPSNELGWQKQLAFLLPAAPLADFGFSALAASLFHAGTGWIAAAGFLSMCGAAGFALISGIMALFLLMVSPYGFASINGLKPAATAEPRRDVGSRPGDDESASKTTILLGAYAAGVAALMAGAAGALKHFGVLQALTAAHILAAAGPLLAGGLAIMALGAACAGLAKLFPSLDAGAFWKRWGGNIFACSVLSVPVVIMLAVPVAQHLGVSDAALGAAFQMMKVLSGVSAVLAAVIGLAMTAAELKRPGNRGGAVQSSATAIAICIPLFLMFLLGLGITASVGTAVIHAAAAICGMI